MIDFFSQTQHWTDQQWQKDSNIATNLSIDTNMRNVEQCLSHDGQVIVMPATTARDVIVEIVEVHVEYTVYLL